MSFTGSPFMSGVPELLVLRLLARQRMYGYELAKAVQAASGQTLSLGEGVLYPVLHALEAGGALKASEQTIGGRTRVYYELTARGRRRLQRLSQRWREVSGAVATILES